MLAIPFDDLRPSKTLSRRPSKLTFPWPDYCSMMQEGGPSDTTAVESMNEHGATAGGGENANAVEINHHTHERPIETNGSEPHNDSTGDSSMVATTSPPLPEVAVNGSSEDPSRMGSDATPSRAGFRNTSAKFANLRAAFEKTGPGEGTSDGLKRRFPSNSDVRPSRSRERNPESETEIAKLKEEMTQERELRTAYEERVTHLEEEIDSLQEKLERGDEAWQAKQTEAADQLCVVQTEARTRRDENSALQRQLSDLKRSISTSTRSSAPTSDSTFKQEIGILQHEVQNWVVNHFRKAKSDASPAELCEKLKGLDESKQLDRLRPIYERFDAGNKLAVYQATVACYLMEIFDEPFLFGMPADQEWRKRIKKAAHSLLDVLDPAAYSRWRAATVDAIRQSDAVKESVDSATNGMAEMICITLRAMTAVEDGEGKALASLKTIVKRAVSLAHSVRVQPGQYDFLLPSPPQPFDAASMDDISLDDGDARPHREILCTTFPAVVKLGDEQGDHRELRNVLVKAKVLCDDGRDA